MPEYYIILFDHKHQIRNAVGYEVYPTVADIITLFKTINEDEFYTYKLDIISKDEFNKIKKG